ncbi:pentatricopeptide repeat-containing protein At2g20540-like [Wolffia australiana]
MAATSFFPCPCSRAFAETHLPLSSRASSSFTSSSSSSSPHLVGLISARVRTLCIRGRSAELDRAISAFDEWGPNPPPFLYKSLIKALHRTGLHRRALRALVAMLHGATAFPDDAAIFVLALQASAQLAALDVGEQIHGLLLKSRPLSAHGGVSLANALAHMYVQCGSIDLAWQVFERMPDKNVISWNTMIAGCARAEDLESARKLFDDMPDRNIVSWNTMISGYARTGRPEEALALFLRAQEVGFPPDEATVVAIVAAVADLGLLSFGKAAHAHAVRLEFSIAGALGVSMIVMYSRCGSVEAARRVFAEIPGKNVAHWTAMIGGLAAHGAAEEALELFQEMLGEGMRPNHITFVGLLNACSHGGLVEEGLRVLQLMGAHGVELQSQHVGCAVDLLARSGLVEEALAIARAWPREVQAWTALLSACRRRGDAAGVAKAAAERLMELEPGDGAAYVLLSGVYAGQGNWEQFGRARRAMTSRGLDKVPAHSWIEVGGARHEFAAGDGRHSRRREIYATLSAMALHLSSADTPIDLQFPS